MSLDNFLSFLQQLITMTDPNDGASVALAKNALTSVVALAKSSGMLDSDTHIVMSFAEKLLMELLRNKKDFAGRPGDYLGNRRKRHRLLNVLQPGC